MRCTPFKTIKRSFTRYKPYTTRPCRDRFVGEHTHTRQDTATFPAVFQPPLLHYDAFLVALFDVSQNLMCWDDEIGVTMKTSNVTLTCESRSHTYCAKNQADTSKLQLWNDSRLGSHALSHENFRLPPKKCFQSDSLRSVQYFEQFAKHISILGLLFYTAGDFANGKGITLLLTVG